MSLGDVIARLAVNLTLETAAFEEGATIAEKRLAQSAKKIDAIGQKMTSIGTKLSVGFTLPFVAAGKAAIQGFVDQEKAMADVTAALNSMGGASGKTAQQLSDAADAMEMNSLFDADMILKQVTANLLTFGNVSGEVFDRAQQAAVDMATRLGTEPQAAAIMLGKALNDPVKGLTALSKVGVSFTAAQKEQIKAMVAAGDVAGAQGIILDELGREYSGAAAAAADADPWRKAQVAIGQASDVLGQQLLPLIKPVTDAIVGVVKAFASLPEPIQQFIVIAAAAGAAFGPLLTAVGAIVSAGSTIFAAIGSIAGSMMAVGTAAGAAEVGVAAAGGAFTVLGAALGPILAVVAGVAAAGYLIYENWDKIAPVLEDLWQSVQSTIGPPLQRLITAITTALTDLWSGPFGSMIRAAGSAIAGFGGVVLEWLGSRLVDAVKAAASVIGTALEAASGVVRTLTALFKGDFSKAFEIWWQTINRIFGGLPAYVARQISAMVSAVRVGVVDRLGAIWDSAMEKVEKVKRAFFHLYDAVVGHSYVPDMVDGIAEQMQRLDTVLVNRAEQETKSAAEKFRDLATEVNGLLAELFPEAVQLNATKSKLELIDKGQSADMPKPDQADAARIRLFGQNGAYDGTNDIISNYPKLIDATNDNAAKIGKANQAIGQSFADMAQQAVGSLRQLTDSIKSGDFLGILGSALSLIGGLIGGNTGVTIGKIGGAMTNGLPGYANGTKSARSGLSLVGENGPELVNFRGGERVYNNADSAAMMSGSGRRGGDVYYIGPGAEEFWGKVKGVASGEANTAVAVGKRRDVRRAQRKFG